MPGKRVALIDPLLEPAPQVVVSELQAGRPPRGGGEAVLAVPRVRPAAAGEHVPVRVVGRSHRCGCGDGVVPRKAAVQVGVERPVAPHRIHRDVGGDGPRRAVHGDVHGERLPVAGGAVYGGPPADGHRDGDRRVGVGAAADGYDAVTGDGGVLVELVRRVAPRRGGGAVPRGDAAADAVIGLAEAPAGHRRAGVRVDALS